MKRTGLLIAGLIAATVTAYAALDAYTPITVKTIKLPMTGTGTQTNAATDVYDAKGICSLIVTHGPRTAGAASWTNTVTLTTCATTGGTYTVVTSAANTATTGTGTVSVTKVDAASLGRYVKLITANGTNTCANSAVLLYSK